MTEGQQRALAYIREYIREHGGAPTRAEIKAGLGIMSRSWVDELIYQLERRGALRTTPGEPRGIVLCVPLDAPQWQGFETSPQQGQLVLLRSRFEDYPDFRESYTGPVDGWYYTVEVWLRQPHGDPFNPWEQWRAVW
jgi:SOS-response transcriptional repressor LexA